MGQVIKVVGLLKYALEIAWVPCYYVYMIQNFLNMGTEDIFNGKNTKNARKILSPAMRNVTTRKLDQLDSVIASEELRVPPGNRLEALTGNRKRQFSIRINDQYRICFKWKEAGPYDVEITDYH